MKLTMDDGTVYVLKEINYQSFRVFQEVSWQHFPSLKVDRAERIPSVYEYKAVCIWPKWYSYHPEQAGGQ